MERINKILSNEQYKEYVRKIELAETDREFCRHDMVHFLDVCRLAEILYLKDREVFRLRANEAECHKANDSSRLLEINEEWIYAAGLMHDIGRWQEYEDGTPHEAASSRLAPDILRECGFAEEEIREICIAIGNHRNKTIKEEVSLSGYLYRADKMSRPCFSCKAEKKCDWDRNKKNLQIQF